LTVAYATILISITLIRILSTNLIARSNSVLGRKKRPMRISEQNPTVVYCHSQTGNRVEGLFLLKLCADRRYNLLLFDFPGSGKSEGEYISLGWFEPIHLDNILEDLRKRFEVNCIALWGRSMGAVTSIRIAERNTQDIKAIVLDSPFSDLEELVKRIGKVNLKVPQIMMTVVIKMMSSPIQRRLGIDLFSLRPIDSVKHCTVPAFFIAGANDQIVPEASVVELYKRYKAKRKVIAYSKAGHSNEREPALLLQGIAMIGEEFNHGTSKGRYKQGYHKMATGGPFFDPFLAKKESLEKENCTREQTALKLEESTRDKIENWHLSHSDLSQERSSRHEFTKTLDLSSIDGGSNIREDNARSSRLLCFHKEASDWQRTRVMVESHVGEPFPARDHSREIKTSFDHQTNPTPLPARPPPNARPPLPSTPNLKPYQNFVIFEHISRIRDTSIDSIGQKPTSDTFVQRSTSGAHPRNRSIHFIDQNNLESVLQTRPKDIFRPQFYPPVSISKPNYEMPTQTPGSPISRNQHNLRHIHGASGIDLLQHLPINCIHTPRKEVKPQSAGFFKYTQNLSHADPNPAPKPDPQSHHRIPSNSSAFLHRNFDRTIPQHYTESLTEKKDFSPLNTFDNRYPKQLEANKANALNSYNGHFFRRPSQS
jgi:pimeloyl-ACP methyl ester carboxylesterase